MKVVPNPLVGREIEQTPEFQQMLYDAADDIRDKAQQLVKTPLPHPGFWSEAQWRWAFWHNEPWAMERALATPGGPRIRYRRLPERSHVKRKRHYGRFVVTQDGRGTRVTNVAPTAQLEEYGFGGFPARAPLRRAVRAAGLRFRRV